MSVIGNVLLSGGSGGGGTSIPNLVSLPYASLKTLRDNDSLVPGTVYRINDYETIITGSYDLSLIGAQGYLHNAVTAGHQFDILVMAIDGSHLSEDAGATLHSGDTYFSNAGANLGAWELKYSLDNDSTKYAWASSSGKGVIWWMKDEWNNQAGYDFKNIQFIRYALSRIDSSSAVGESLEYNPAADQYGRYGSMYQIFTALQSYMDSGTYVDPFADSNLDFAVSGNILGTIQMPSVNSIYLSTFAADLYYTFDYWDETNSVHIDASMNTLGKVPCRENYIELESDPVPAALTGQYNKLGFGGSVWETDSIYTAGLSLQGWNSISENHLSMHNWCNTFGNDCNSNTFSNVCFSNTFGDSCYSNTFGDSCDSNTFGSYCHSNTFGDSCDSNTFGDRCYSNTFGVGCYSNTFGDSCYSNTFGDSCDSNTFGSYCHSNTFGVGCYSNTFSNVCFSNTFGDSCYSNTFDDHMAYLRCGDHVQGITATDSEYGSHTYTIKSLVNYDGNSGYATLITETGYGQVTAISTTDGGNTWTSV